MARFIWNPKTKNWTPESVARWRKPRGPAIHRDQLDALWAPFNGQRYDSKSRMNADAKALGLECVGNDSSILSPRAPEVQIQGDVGADLARAFEGRNQ